MPDAPRVTVHAVPVHAGRLIAFAVDAPDDPGAGGRWLPWTPLAPGGEPWETASELVDEWCGEALAAELRLLDALAAGDGLALVFRAGLTAMPDARRGVPHACAPADLDAIRGFARADLERWLGAGEAPSARTLVF